jgi:hypothetical protein
MRFDGKRDSREKRLPAPISRSGFDMCQRKSNWMLVRFTFEFLPVFLALICRGRKHFGNIRPRVPSRYSRTVNPVNRALTSGASGRLGVRVPAVLGRLVYHFPYPRRL